MAKDTKKEQEEIKKKKKAMWLARDHVKSTNQFDRGRNYQYNY